MSKSQRIKAFLENEEFNEAREEFRASLIQKAIAPKTSAEDRETYIAQLHGVDIYHNWLRAQTNEADDE